MGQTAASGKPDAYIPALDGLRAISILLVVLSHVGLGRFLPGAFGVTLFFFISGYLITRQLLARLQIEGHLRLANFYLRRALRLMPAALAYIILAGALFSLAGGQITPGGWAAALFYGANYFDLSGGYRSTLAGVRHPFNILWSLAVEEHFYIVWPVLLTLLWRRNIVIAGLLTLCVAILAWRTWLFGACFHPLAPGICAALHIDPDKRFEHLYFATDTRLDSIAYGALLAAIERNARRLPAAAWPAAGLLAATFMLQGEFAHEVLRTSMQGAALLFLIPRALEPDTLAASLLSRPLMVAIGRLSYSLYLWHWGALVVADLAAPRGSLTWALIALPLAAGLAWLSYRCIEQPMLALRRRAGSHAPQTSLSETPHAAA